MTDPYKVLGVSPTDSDDVIKKAYKEQIKKYHPDQYASSPLGELAEEKTVELNAAYDQIMDMRRGGNSSGNSGVGNYFLIRQKIQSGNITEADKMLDDVGISFREAEWYFLKGSVSYKRGWLDQAYSNIEKASSMEPYNQEYNAALNNLKMTKNGQFMRGNPYPQYRTTNTNGSGCTGCEMCQGLICADCCCECMGGDLIGCC